MNPCFLPSLWKIRKKLSLLSPVDHPPWQHKRENPRHARGSAGKYVVMMVQFVLKIEKLFHVIGARGLTISVLDYGPALSYETHARIWMFWSWSWSQRFISSQQTKRQWLNENQSGWQPKHCNITQVSSFGQAGCASSKDIRCNHDID